MIIRIAKKKKYLGLDAHMMCMEPSVTFRTFFFFWTLVAELSLALEKHIFISTKKKNDILD